MENLEFRELARKYNHTYANIKQKANGKVIPVYFDRVGQTDDGTYYANVYTPAEKYVPNFSTQQAKISFNSFSYKLSDFTILDVPETQVFDALGRTLYYTRNPARQWQKGICSANCNLIDPILSILEALPRSTEYEVKDYSRTNFSLDTLYNLFNPNVAETFTQALSDIEKHDIFSRTIDGKYYVSRFPSKTYEYMLFRFNIPLAYYNPKIDTFMLINKIYIQEMSDFLRHNKLTSKLEVDDEQRNKSK